MGLLLNQLHVICFDHMWHGVTRPAKQQQAFVAVTLRSSRLCSSYAIFFEQ